MGPILLASFTPGYPVMAKTAHHLIRPGYCGFLYCPTDGRLQLPSSEPADWMHRRHETTRRPSFLLSNSELANPDAAGLVISRPTNDRNVTKRGVDESLVICVTARTSGPDLRNMLFQLFLALSVGSLRGSRGITRITCGRSFVYHSAGFPFGNTARVFCILGPNTIDISGRMRWIPELP